MQYPSAGYMQTLTFYLLSTLARCYNFESHQNQLDENDAKNVHLLVKINARHFHNILVFIQWLLAQEN